jgi:hypothetical protein
MVKSPDDSFADWEGHVFGFGYGTGEPHTLLALKQFLELCPDQGAYDYRVIEDHLGAAVTWLMISILCRADVLEYGSSPRYAWLTKEGLALKSYVESKSVDDLVNTACRDENYIACYPDACNCGPDGYEEGRVCLNPFWLHR